MSEKKAKRGRPQRLTPKMETFVDCYFANGFNGALAYEQAGYSYTKDASNEASRLLKHPKVQELVQERKAERKKDSDLSAEYVIQKLIAIADANEADNPTASLRSLELLGKHLGLYKDRQEISGPDGEAIQMMEQKTQENVESFKSKLASLANRRGPGKVTEFPKPTGDGSP